MRLIFLVLTVGLLLGICSVGAAAEIPDNLWQGLIAEATEDGEAGMTAVAMCVRNRLAQGMSLGLSGLKRRDLGQFCAREGVLREILAKRIVKQVFFEDLADVTGGATHFESTNFLEPYWAKDMEVTVQIGHHIFYKEVK